MTDTLGAVTQSLPISNEQKQQITENAGQVAQQVGSQLTEQVGSRVSEAGSQASSIAGALRISSRQLEDQGQTAPAHVMNMAANRADQVGTYLSGSDPSQILADVEDFCRQQPWLVIGAGVALGFLGARFLKASSSRRYNERRATWSGPNGRVRAEAYGYTAYEPDEATYRSGGI
jgi:hypothetical protein